MKASLAVVTLAVSFAIAQEPIRGIPASRLNQHKALEERIRKFPEPPRARQYMRRMAAEPHHAGSPQSKAVAEYALGLFKGWGFDARIEEFEALLPFPTATRLEMTAPVSYRAKLQEPVMAEDPDSGDRNQLPLYNAYAASGDVTGPLVYVNYGIPDDYKRLAKLGIDVKGKIVIARYGQSWRGTKAKVAQEQGAVGCIIYSDPRDDGYFQGDAFPKGPYRPAESAQRGSVMDMPVAVGDPLSPGWASEKGSKRLAREEATTIMKIPVLPVSYGDARPLLEQLGGPVAPLEWRGALPLTYHIGPGPATVRLSAEFDWTTKPLYNVIARIPGSVTPDEWVLYGNHHDAWVNGASDPISGAIALLETARSFSELRKTGWKPRRTLLFALWDGEEFGLVGSTEWVEKHREELQQKLVVYLNSDNNTGGPFHAGGSSLLNEFMREVARDCRDPRSGRDLLRKQSDDGQESKQSEPFALSPLGAGSDYVAFQHHAGIPSLNLAFNGPGNAGTYHSIYDSVAWFEKTMDKDYQYSRALAQVFSTAILRLSEAPAHPFAFRFVEQATRGWVKELREPGGLDVSDLNDALDTLKRAGERFEKAYASAAPRMEAMNSSDLVRLNSRLREMERALTAPEGLPGRPFYRHLLFAPGLYTGYSAKTLPNIREPLDGGNKAEAQRQVKPMAATLRGFAQKVDDLSSELEKL